MEYSKIAGRFEHYKKHWLLLAGTVMASVLALLLVLLLGAPADTQAAALPDGLHMLSADANGVELELDVAHYTLTSRTVDSGKFMQLSVDGTQQDTAVKGAPQLPVRAVVLGIPQDADVQVSVSGLRSQLVPQPIRLLPVPTEQVVRSRLDSQNVTDGGPSYLPDAAAYALNQLQPAAAAGVLKIGNMRSQRYVSLQLNPFQYNAARQSLQWNQHMHVSVRFVYPPGRSAANSGKSQPEGAYETVLRAQLLNYDVSRGWRAPPAAPSGYSGPLRPQSAGGDYRISTDRAGIYRLTYATLMAAGVPPGSDPHTFKIRKDGAQIPIYVSGEQDGSFDPSDYVEFYAQAIDNQYTNVNVYWLSVGGVYGLRMASRGAAPITAPALESFRDRIHLEENHKYLQDRPVGNGDHWFWNEVVLGLGPNPSWVVSPGIYTMTVPDASISGTAALRAAALGVVTGNPADSSPHEEQVYVNGNLVLDDSWDTNPPHVGEGSFSQAGLVSGTNTISYSLQYTAGIGFDGVVINWFELDYQHLYRAQNDYLAFGADITGAIQITVSNFTTRTLAVYDVTSPTNTIRLSNTLVTANGSAYALSLGDQLSSTSRYIASAAGLSPLSVVRDTAPSNLLDPAHGADEIIIVGDDLFTATAPLAAERSSQGLRTMRVRISDVYDEFSDGVFDPLAIQRFLSYTYSYWGSPAPQYVLLVGNGNFNYRNFQPNNIGPTDVQIIPPYMDNVDPFINQAASDNRYVRFGPDDMPYMAIGRLPVRTVSETTTYINKLLAYEQALPAGVWQRTVDFFTDNYYLGGGNYDTAGDFYGTADALAGHLPTFYANRRVYYCIDTCPEIDPWYVSEPSENSDPVHVRYAITTTLNSGALFANYVGHASFYQWANEAIFYNASAPLQYPRPDPLSQLQNGLRLPIVLELTCRTGSFYLPGVRPLAQSWLLNPNGGAIADWASTGLGVNDGHGLMASQFYDAIYINNVRNLGLATNTSKAYLVSTNQYLDLVDEFTLFGDPAMIIPQPQPLLPLQYLPLINR